MPPTVDMYTVLLPSDSAPSIVCTVHRDAAVVFASQALVLGCNDQDARHAASICRTYSLIDKIRSLVCMHGLHGSRRASERGTNMGLGP